MKASTENPGISTITKYNSGMWYLAYVQQHIFVPTGVQTVTCWPQASYKDAMAYDVAKPTVSGVVASVDIYSCGGHRGLHLSAIELANFMAHIRYDTSILSAKNRSRMDSYRLGWSKNSNSGGSYTGKLWHAGDLFWTSGTTKRELHSCIMKYPNNIEATLLINSSENFSSTQCGVLKSAYDSVFS